MNNTATHYEAGLQAIVDRMRRYVGSVEDGHVIANWAEELEALVKPAASPVSEAHLQDEELVVAQLAACEATLRHLWDIAARFDSKDCNAIRDEIHILNKITLPSIRDLAPRLAPAASSSSRTPNTPAVDLAQELEVSKARHRETSEKLQRAVSRELAALDTIVQLEADLASRTT